MNKEYFECECTSLNHVLRFSVLDWDKNQYNLVVDCVLHNRRGFWKRLILGIKYVFCYRKAFNGWQETLIRNEDIPRLRAMIVEYEALITKGGEK
jgi:hypothetical protein